MTTEPKHTGSLRKCEIEERVEWRGQGVLVGSLRDSAGHCCLHGTRPVFYFEPPEAGPGSEYIGEDEMLMFCSKCLDSVVAGPYQFETREEAIAWVMVEVLKHD